MILAVAQNNVEENFLKRSICLPADLVLDLLADVLGF